VPLTAGPDLPHAPAVRCHACQTDQPLASGERIGFRDECAECGADLHACRNCAHHDPSAYNECRESGSERVSDRERANRCDWFAPGQASREGGARESALGDLEALFKK